jgi:hypothetical protein
MIKFLRENEFNYPNLSEAIKASFMISDLPRYICWKEELFCLSDNPYP